MVIDECAATFPEEDKSYEEILNRIRCADKEVKDKLEKIEILTPKGFLDFPLGLDERI